MVPSLLAELPANTPLAFSGRGPNWLYGAFVGQTGPEPFYQFGSRLGWVRLLPLHIGTQDTAHVSTLQIRAEEWPGATVLKIDIAIKYLVISTCVN